MLAGEVEDVPESAHVDVPGAIRMRLAFGGEETSQVVHHLDVEVTNDLIETAAVADIPLHVRPATAVLGLWLLDIEADDPRRILVMLSETGNQLGPNLPFRAGNENSSRPRRNRSIDLRRVAFFEIRP